MNTPTGITIPTFEAKERAKAIAELQQLPPSVLPYCSDLINQFNSKKDNEIDEQAARELISELTYCYFLLPISIRQEHTIFRGRPVEAGTRVPNVAELGPPPAQVATTGRANGHGESIFYGGSSDETVFSELQLAAGHAVNIAAFSVKPMQEITAYVIGEMDHLRRWGRPRFLPAGLEVHSQEILSSLHPDVALAIQLVDAFFADRFSRKGKEAYRVTNLIAREFLQSQTIDAIVFPSVAHPGGFNYAIKSQVSTERLQVRACVAVEILKNYGYGSYLGGRYGLAKVSPADTTVHWITPEHDPKMIQQFKEEMQKDPDPITAWMMGSGSR